MSLPRKDMRLSELEAALAAQGWTFHHQTSSHRIYRSADGLMVPFACKNRPGEVVKAGLVAAIQRDIERAERDHAARAHAHAHARVAADDPAAEPASVSPAERRVVQAPYPPQLRSPLSRANPLATLLDAAARRAPTSPGGTKDRYHLPVPLVLFASIRTRRDGYFGTCERCKKEQPVGYAVTFFVPGVRLLDDLFAAPHEPDGKATEPALVAAADAAADLQAQSSAEGPMPEYRGKWCPQCVSQGVFERHARSSRPDWDALDHDTRARDAQAETCYLWIGKTPWTRKLTTFVFWVQPKPLATLFAAMRVLLTDYTADLQANVEAMEAGQPEAFRVMIGVPQTTD